MLTYKKILSTTLVKHVPAQAHFI
ncbi:hypothetical protein EMIT047CA2_60009 [Pseudomonas soli]